jgi:hypothetical protein
MGDTGFEVLTPDGTTRLWSSRGTFAKTGKVADWKPKPKTEPTITAPSKTVSHELPYKSAGDLAAMYRQSGLDRYRAWDQYVKDTILQRRYRSDQVDAKDFFRYYDD